MRNWIILIVSVATFSSVYADESMNTKPISLKQVIVNVLERNPQILASDYQARAAVARIDQARQPLSPLSLNIEFENFSGTGEYSGTDQLETTLSFAKVLELGRKPELRESVARQKTAILKNEQDAKKLDLLAEATRRFIHLLLDQQNLELAQIKLSLVKDMRGLVAKRVKLGKSPQAELRRVNIEFERAKIELEHSEHELDTSRLRLLSMWGDTSSTLISANADLYALQELASFEILEKHLKNNPDLVYFATRERLTIAQINLAKSRQKRDLKLSGGVRHFNATSDTALILSASIPFGTSSRAKPYIKEAQLLSEITPHELEQKRLILRTNLYALYQEIQHAFYAVNVLQKTIIPEAELVLRDYKRGYEAGRYSITELNTAQRALIEARREAAVTASNYHQIRIEIERLTGQHMTQLEVEQ